MLTQERKESSLKQIHVYVITVNDGRITVETNPQSTITMLRNDIFQQHGIDTKGQEMILSGTGNELFRSYRTLSEYGIENGSTIHMHGKSMGRAFAMVVDENSDWKRMFTKVKWKDIYRSQDNPQFIELLRVLSELTNNTPSKIRNQRQFMNILQDDGYYNNQLNKQFIEKNLGMPLKEYIKGCSLAIASAVLFSLNAVLIKLASNIGYQSMEIFLFRSVIQLSLTIFLTIVVVIYAKRSNLPVSAAFKTKKELIKWIIMRGLAAALAGICYFHAVCVIPLGDAVTIFSIYLFFATLMGWIFLERCTSCNKIVLCVSVIIIITGFVIYMISNPQFYFGYIVCIFGAISAGCVFIGIRLATENTSPLLLLYSHVICCLLLSFIFGAVFQEFHLDTYKKYPLETTVILIGFCIVGFCGQFVMNKSTNRVSSTFVSTIRSFDCIPGYFWQIVIFSLIPTKLTVIGGICIFVGVFLVLITKLCNKNEAETTQLNNILNQYGTINTIQHDAMNIDLSKLYYYALRSHYCLSLDPNDSHICLMAEK